MKRKRRDASSSSSLLEESPKRTKVQAQRKFAQNSGVHSPIITPIRDLESTDLPHTNGIIPEPVELLPMKRPNTEDFLTFLCFRGTPVLPTNLQFFNTASIVADGQVHEIKAESPKNGPIDVAKCAGGTSAEKPFIAFGVRKRADPIVISRQMDKKRRHALAIHSLRRKYQEQKMAKIRALTISKLSEKTTNRTLVKTNTSVHKTETVTKKNTTTLQKTKVIATKHVKVTTETLKTKVKPRMCLRSYRGKFIQKELPFRPRRLVGEEVKPGKSANVAVKRGNIKKEIVSKQSRITKSESNGSILRSPATSKHPQVKRRILLPSTIVTTIVKPKLRSTTTKKTVISRKKAQQRLRPRSTNQSPNEKPPTPVVKKVIPKKKPLEERDKQKDKVSRRLLRKDSDLSQGNKSTQQEEVVKTVQTKKEIVKVGVKKVIKENIGLKKELILRSDRTARNIKRNVVLQKNKSVVAPCKETSQKVQSTVRKVVTRKSEVTPLAKKTKPEGFKSKSVPASLEKVSKNSTEPSRRVTRLTEGKPKVSKKGDPEFSKKIQDLIDNALKDAEKTGDQVSHEEIKLQEVKIEVEKVDDKQIEAVVVEIHKESHCIENQVEVKKEEDIKIKQIKKEDKRRIKEQPEQLSAKTSLRPTRKTKEAAAIYMEILSHKLVNDSTVDDDVSIGSFPELPNVKKTEQREIELKAQAKNVVKSDEDKKPVTVELSKEIEMKTTSNKKANDLDSDDEVLQAKICKKDKESSRRQTRSSANTVNKASESDSSDESFHVDLRVLPKKKKNTRSRNRSSVDVLEKNVDIILEAAKILEEDQKEEPESGSDESTTSDINLKNLQIKQRDKKLSKKKSSVHKSVESFSDSDEEPLVKLAMKKPPSTTDKPPKKKSEEPVMEPKPKRECTKRPSNYLAMLSSSSSSAGEEPYLRGFTAKQQEPVDKVKGGFVQAVAPSLELLNQDLGRKGKVNMSNEQIEQWLKDSALAGSSVAKENDAMLKFGEKLPSECPELKAEIESSEGSEAKIVEKKCLKLDTVQARKEVEKPKSECAKSPLNDRKWIFKKDKKDALPNKNAFSPENECSVYAFGEDNEDTFSTPFRRPSRRPSSTATSRSEDEMSKNDDSLKLGQFRKPNPSDSEDSRCFNVPQNKAPKLTTMVPPTGTFPSKRHQPRPLNFDKCLEPFDECKYKVPSSPSASSGSSCTKLNRKASLKTKGSTWEPINPVYVTEFPKPSDPAKLVEAPVFHPTEQEFQDPLEYIERIRHKAEQFGICRIVPPTSFKPECKVADDMRFTAYNQYVHKMLHRWGPNFKEFIVIRKYLATQSISLKTPPLIGGMEIDLPRLYQTVQSLGGLKEVIEKKKWPRVSDQMKIPKLAQDRVTKLDDIYCKYLLPYDTLSPAEREKLFDDVETYWAKKESRLSQSEEEPASKAVQPNLSAQDDSSEDSDEEDDDIEECTVKGKNMALNAFYRIARNTMAMYFKVAEPTALEVEQEFWKYVTQKQNHICVHSASIDCGTWGYGFAVSKNSPFARHAWNLKVLSNNNGSVLRSLGPVMGVTVPTLHVGMVFSACCWYRDPHGLPWVEYLHTGGNKIWYGIPSSSCGLFHGAMKKLVPNYCRDKEMWLPSDTAMVPPDMLIDNNVSLCRTIQEPGQFMVVFPKVYTSSICTGYVVSESVYFAPLYWLRTAKSLFNDLKASCEPSMFSLDKLLVSISNDSRSSVEALRVILPFVEELCRKEISHRSKLRGTGQVEEEKVTSIEQPVKKRKIQSVEGDFECEVCRMNLFVSMVTDTKDDLVYCLEDAVKLVEKNPKTPDRFKMKYSFDEDQLNEIPKRINAMIEAKTQKKIPGKFAGMPTLLT